MVSSEKILRLMKERRSVRFFNGKKVALENILAVIEAGIWAPTGCNNQELKFLILNKKEEIDKIIDFKPFLKGVSTIVLIFCDMSSPRSQKMYIKTRAQKHLPYVDTGLALGNMILYAKSKGIDSCLLNLSEYHFKSLRTEKSTVKKMFNLLKFKLGFHKLIEENMEYCLRNQFNIPAYLRLICGVAFGYAKKYPDVKTERHGTKRLMREDVDNYIIKKE